MKSDKIASTIGSLICFSIVALLFWGLSLDAQDARNAERKWFQYEIVSLRIDDDSEFHYTAFSDNGSSLTEDDDKSIRLVRRDVKKPYLKILNLRIQGQSDWRPHHLEDRIIIIPLDYKIEYFND